MSSSIEKKLEQIELSIREDLTRVRELAATSKTFAIIGGVCLAGVVLVKAPIFLLGAAVGGVGFAVSKITQMRREEMLNDKYQTQASLLIVQEKARQADEPAPSMAPKNDNGIKAGFDNNASRVDQLAEQVDELKQQVEGKPIELDKPKGLFGRFKK